MRDDEALYLTDSYLREFDARVLAVAERRVRLDRTAFYPTGGGQPCDTGRLTTAATGTLPVESVEKTDAGIVHVLAPGASPPNVGDTVHGEIDWERRYRHMRYHTLLHLLSGVVFRRFGRGITGGQISSDRARMDFSLDEFSRPLADELLVELNRVARNGLAVRVRFIDRSHVAAEPSLVRVAAELLPDVATLRVIDIEGYDVQADGGTHVRSTLELGEARLEKIENKGARNKRLYLILPDAPPAADGSVPA